MNRFVDNLESLRKTDEQLAALLEKYSMENNTVKCEKDAKGRNYPVLEHDGRVWRLSSSYDSMYAAETFFEERVVIKPYAVYYLLGFGDGKVIEKYRETMDDTNILVVYEPNPEVIFCMMQTEDYSSVFTDKRIIFLLEGLNDSILDALVSQITTYDNYRLTDLQILPAYDVLYPEKCRMFIDMVVYYQKKVVLNRNTETDAKMKLTENILSNMYDYTFQSNLYLLKEEIQKENLADIPAIIISAGPSLDKNIEELKQAEGKAFLIGVDAALKALIRHGIHIQLGITVDPAKDMTLFGEEGIQDIPMVLEDYSTKELVAVHKNRHFYSMGYGSEYMASVCEKLAGYKVPALPTGGSVATEAFALAELLGFKTIILVGQDLAFTNGRGHVSSVCDDEEKNKEHLAHRVLTTVPDIDGNPVQTDMQMSVYIEWFGKEAYRVRDSIRTIDATEGGARIPNTEVMPLREVIAQECRRTADFDAIIRRTPDTFTKEQQEQVLAEYSRIPKELERLQKTLEKIIPKYEQLIRLAKNPNATKHQYEKALEGLTDIDALGEKEPLLTLVAQYCRKTEYELTEGVYEAEDLKISDMAERAIGILKGYISGMDEFREDLPILLEQISKRKEEKER